MNASGAKTKNRRAATADSNGKIASTPREPALREIVREASAALARLDADRLEELARCCCALNRDTGLDTTSLDSLWNARRGSKPATLPPDMVRQVREAAGDFAVFTRVLEATRANLDVMHRLCSVRGAFGGEELEYGQRVNRRCENRNLNQQESSHGND